MNAVDRFAWIGSFSMGTPDTNLAELFPVAADTLNARLKLLWIVCGREDHVYRTNKRLVAWLKSKDIRHTWVETSDIHSFRAFRRDLILFAPLLFRE